MPSPAITRTLRAKASATQAARARNVLVPDRRAWSDLPALRGALGITSEDIEAGSEILMEDQTGAPLVVVRHYDAGRVALVGIDDTWRWRRGVGDRYLHRFYSELIRHLAAASNPDGTSWRLITSPTRGAAWRTGAGCLAPDTTTLEPTELPNEVAIELTAEGHAPVVTRLVRDADDTSFALTIPAPGLGAGPGSARQHRPPWRSGNHH